jgi:CHAP domain-containing protein
VTHPANNDPAISRTGWAWGQCVWWVAGFYDLPFGGDAKNLVQGARGANWQIQSAPQPGALVVWQPGHGGASDAGHVAIVTDVQGSDYTVSEMNYSGGVGRPDTRPVRYIPGDADFIIPPRSAAITPGLTQLLGNVAPVFGPSSPGTGTATLASSTAPGGDTPVLGPLISFFYFAGEVVLGLVFLLAGVWLTAGKPGQRTVVNLAGAVPGAQAARAPGTAINRARATQRATATRTAAVQERESSTVAREQRREAAGVRAREHVAGLQRKRDSARRRASTRARRQRQTESSGAREAGELRRGAAPGVRIEPLSA